MMTIDLLWLFTATLMVLAMQAGFLMLEAGRVRSKNSISVAQKNVSDLVISWVTFFGFGYWLMFGIAAPLSDEASLARDGQAHAVLTFLYQLGFCATAASIVSGGIAERMSYTAYLALVFLTSALIYPLAGRWIWGGLGDGWSGSWLAGLGFVDFAGSTVVHGVGAWVALAGILVVGPRVGRFSADGQVKPIAGHNAAFSLLGVLILLIGWFGFNGGAVSPSDPLFARIMLGTSTAACFGAFAGMLAGGLLDKGVFNPSRITSGLLGGLVAITACAHLASSFESMLVGVAGGLVATVGAEWLLVRWRLDDPVDVVATHGLAGVVGTVAVAFVGEPEALPAGGRLAQALVQFGGALAVFVLAFGTAYALLGLLSGSLTLRVSAEQERLGLNHTEHGEALGAERLQRALTERLGADDPSTGPGADARVGRFGIDAGDDAAELASAVNELLDRQDRARAVIHASQQRFEQFALTASDWLWETDARFTIRYVSATADVAEERTRGTLAGAKLSELLRMRRAENALVREAVRARRPIPPCEANLLLPCGERRIVEVRGMPYNDAEGRFLGYRGTFHDVTERHGAERRAMFLSRHDALTGLANRRALSEDIAEMLGRCDERTGLVVAVIDLDGFKGVNDGYGHAVGDRLLKAVAGRLTDRLRTGDRVFRVGGDEFVVVLSGLAVETMGHEGEAWAERLIEHLSEPYDVLTHRLDLGASVGLALCPTHGREAEELAHRADLALYVAKEKGKGRVERFEPKMDADARGRIELEEHLRHALANDELSLHYQPQYDGESSTLTGFEALMRWHHPTLGNVPPDVFIEAAERIRIMDEIGAFALRSACRFAAGWPRGEGADELVIAVNVSPSQFDNPRFVEDVENILAETGLPSVRLELEVTEEMLIRNLDQVRATLQRLRDIGVSIAVDDFGSGQTSLRYLDRLPISKLKIDRSLIDGLERDRRVRDITESIVALGHKLGCRVVAEGVECRRQATMLRGWKCDQMQGYMFARPMPADEVVSMLTGMSDAGARRRAN